MNWATFLKYAGPIVSALLAWLTSRNASGIQAGVYAADAANYATTGLAGLGSLASLIAGLVASYRSTGKVPVVELAEVAALQTLAMALTKDGDIDGLALLSPLTAHIVQRKGKPSPIDGLLNDQVIDTIARRIHDRSPKEVTT